MRQHERQAEIRKNLLGRLACAMDGLIASGPRFVQMMARWLNSHGLVLVLLAAPTLVFPGRWTVVGVGLITVSWLARWAATGRLSVTTVLDAPIGLLAVAVAVGTAVSSLPTPSASKAWGVVLGVSLYYALVNRLSDGRWRSWTADSLVASGVGVGVTALLGTNWTQASVVPFPWLDLIYHRLPSVIRGLPGSGLPQSSDLFHPREVGGALVLLLPLAAVSSWRREASLPRRAALALASSVMGTVLLLSQTISGIVGVGVSLWLSAAVADRARRRWWLAGGLGLGAAGLTAAWIRLSGLNLLGSSLTLSAQSASGREHAALGVAARLELWPRALQMIHDTPYTGIGLNTFPWIMDRFYSGFILGPEPHAHNFFLHTGADLGLPGLVALLWLLIAFFLSIAASYRFAADADTRTMSLSLGAGVLAHLLYGTFDAVTLGAKPGVILWAMLGLGIALSRPIPRPTVQRQDWSRWLNCVMGLLLAIAFVVPLAWDGPRLNAGRVLAYRALVPNSPSFGNSSDLSQARSYLESAVKADTKNSGTWYLLGSVAAGLGDTGQAIWALRQGALVDSHRPLQRYALADALFRTGGGIDWVALRSVYDQWTVRYPQRAEWYLTQAIALNEGLGDREAALDLVERGLAAGAEPVGVLEAYRATVAVAVFRGATD